MASSTEAISTPPSQIIRSERRCSSAPWRRLKRERLGGAMKTFHATDFEQTRPTMRQITGINDLWRDRSGDLQPCATRGPTFQGVVFGDIGTSPIYAFREVLRAQGPFGGGSFRRSLAHFVGDRTGRCDQIRDFRHEGGQSGRRRDDGAPVFSPASRRPVADRPSDRRAGRGVAVLWRRHDHSCHLRVECRRGTWHRVLGMKHPSMTMGRPR
jgi:hypothetical protein